MPKGRPRIYCKCGCRERVKPGNTYINHHNKFINYRKTEEEKSKLQLLKSEIHLCQCGCGESVKWNRSNRSWNSYITGHNRKGSKNTKDHIRKVVESNQWYYEIGPSLSVRSKMSKAKKGKPSSRKDFKHTKETIEKFSKSLKGRKAWNKGKNLSEDHKRSLSVAHTNRLTIMENLIKHSCIRQGISREEWTHFISCDPYCQIWTDEYKEFIKERDNNTCQSSECRKMGGKAGILNVHHIDYDKQNCKPDNLITICASCNSRANFNREYWQEYYESIMSNREVIL